MDGIQHQMIGDNKDYLVSVIIPAYNEAPTIKKVIDKLIDLNCNHWSFEILVVNDGSKDSTREIVENLTYSNVKLLSHKFNQGKGSAIKTGINSASGTWIAILDADLELQPNELPKLLSIIEKKNADLLFGKRIPMGKNLLHKFGNWGLNLFATMMIRFKYIDIMTGWKIFRKELIQEWEISSKGFDIEIELSLVLVKKAKRIITAAVSYDIRKYGTSNISTKDGLFCAKRIIQISTTKDYQILSKHPSRSHFLIK